MKKETAPAGEQDKIDVVNFIFDAFARGDLEDINNYLSEDIEWRVWAPKDLPVGGLFRGHSGVQTFLRNHKKMFKMETDEQLGVYVKDNNVLIHGHERATIMPSGKKYDAGYVIIFTVIDGKVSKCEVFVDSYALAGAYHRD